MGLFKILFFRFRKLVAFVTTTTMLGHLTRVATGHSSARLCSPDIQCFYLACVTSVNQRVENVLYLKGRNGVLVL